MLSRLFDGRGSEHLHEYWPNGRGEDYGGLIVDCGNSGGEDRQGGWGGIS